MTDVGPSFEPSLPPALAQSRDETHLVLGWELSNFAIAMVRVACVLVIGFSFVAILQLRGVQFNLSAIGEIALSALIGVAARILLTVSQPNVGDEYGELKVGSSGLLLEGEERRSVLQQLLDSAQKNDTSGGRS